MNGASVTRRSTGILRASSERAMAITLVAPWECPTKTSGPVLPAARSFTMSLSAVDQYTCPATSALMPLALSSLARLSMPVENTPNHPRSRSTRGSAASAQLHHSRASVTARQLAPRRKRDASCAGSAAGGPRCPLRVRAIISVIAPCRIPVGTPLCRFSDVRPFVPDLVVPDLFVPDVFVPEPVEPRSVAPGRFFPHYRAVAIGHANAANPYAACVISPPRFARNLPDTDLPAAA